MEYASVDHWLSLLDSLFSNEPAYHAVRVERAVLSSDSLQAQNARGLAYIRRQSEDSGVLDDVWWLANVLKKFGRGECTMTEAEALQGLKERNLAVRDDLPWWIESRVKDLLARALPPVDPSCVDGRFGPGSVAEGFNTFARWNQVGERLLRNPCPFLGMGIDWDERPCLANTARAMAVPKDAWKLRTITVEPTIHSFTQQWLRELIRLSTNQGCLRLSIMDSFGVRDRSPALQGQRAIQASKGGLATVDLKDASDCFSWAQIHRVFPSWLSPLMSATRSAYASFGGEPEFMRMYAGMGNATTFVVETLYFWAIVTTIAERLRDFSPVTVVGDDIICGAKAASNPLFRVYLRECGIVVNDSKTFASRRPGFREACGIAAFNGRALRQLIRIPGYDVNDPVQRTGIVGLVNRLYRSESNLHSMLAEQLANDLDVLSPGNRSFERINRELAEDTDLFEMTDLPPSRALDEKSCPDLQVVLVKTNVVRPRRRPPVQLWALRPTEALGFLNGQLKSTDSCQGKPFVLVSIPERDDKVSSRVWVRPKQGVPMPVDGLAHPESITGGFLSQ